MKVLIFGLGSIGKRHAKILQKKYDHSLYAFRSGKTPKGNDLEIEEVSSLRDIDAIKPDVAFITNPSSMHIDSATACAQRGMHLFIEKPLGSDTHGLRKLQNLVSKNKLSTYVAYLLRFHPVIKKLKEYCEKGEFLHMRVICSSYLPAWHPKRDPRVRYSSLKKMGGGVIYDLSHEIDYTQYILGGLKNLQGQFSQRSDITSDAEDYVDILAQTPKGPANIHMNFLSQRDQRLIQIDFKDKFIEGDLLKNTIAEYRNGKRTHYIKYKEDLNACFDLQMDYFFKNLKNPRMMNNVFEGAELLRKIHNFKCARAVL